MAHWFHRNPLKASKTQDFDGLKKIAKTPPAAKICGDLRVYRVKALQQLQDPRNAVEHVEKTVNEYLSLFWGLLEDAKGPVKEGESAPSTSASGEAKLQKIETFKWSHSICGNTAIAVPDANYELASVLTELALWYTKRASYLSSNENLSDEEAKEVFKSLRQAAGIFMQAKNICESKLGTGLVEKHSDADPRVLDAYHLQCLAEAQEVTVARAVELKHKSTTITAVALGTSSLFSKADDSLRSIDAAKSGKWRRYLQIKKNIYLAYAHSFKGETLLAEDQCGNAIRSLQEADKCYKLAGQLCKEYASTKGPGKSARPDAHQFFRRLGPIVHQRLEKATHENGFIYHQKVPEETPELETTEIGIASPVEFALPSHNPRWKPEIFAAFDAGKAQSQMTGKDKEDNEKIEPVKEIDDPNSAGNKNETGCVIS